MTARRLGSTRRPQLGPLVTHAHRESVERYIRVGVDEGAELLCGGERPGDQLEAGRSSPRRCSQASKTA